MGFTASGRSTGRHHARLIAVACLALFGSRFDSIFAQSPPVLTTVEAVRALAPEQASKEQAVRLRGVVTVLSGWKSSFFFQDATYGISVDRLNSDPELKSGELVEILGVTGPGKFAPVVKAKTVRILGRGKMPLARTVGSAELSGGTLDSQWATIEGVVRTAIVKPIWGRDVLVLELDIGGGTLVTVRVHDFAKDAWRTLPASIVSLRGVCGTVFNDRRQFVALRWFVSSLDDIKVVRPGPKDLFDRPLRALDSVARFSSGRNAFNPIKVRGVVTYRQGEDRLYVQNASEGVLVQTNQGAALAVGSEVEIVGYARAGDYSPSLEGAAFKLVGGEPHPVQPAVVSASDMIVDKDGFSSSPYDSLLVCITGTLVQVIPGPDESVLFLEEGKHVFTARLANVKIKHVLPAIGSVVSLTGICATMVDAAREPRGFRLLLRSSSDIAIVQAAPWWSAEHAKMVVMIMGVALALMAGLLILFRRETALRHLSLTDPLTGIHNRRGFVLAAERQRKLASRSKTFTLMFYIDVDNFKEINDTLGHKQGDIALQTVAVILRECFRKTDVVGRIGGDEFAILACNAGEHSRVELERRLAALVDSSNQKVGVVFQLSISVGVLLCEEALRALSVEELMARTDVLMYEQKTNRRNHRQPPAHVPAIV